MARKPREWTPAEIAEVKAWEARQLAAGMCPWSGLPLGPGPNGVGHQCSICDCGGIPAEKMGKGMTEDDRTRVPTTPSNDPPAKDPDVAVPKAEPGPLTEVGPEPVVEGGTES